MKERPILFNGEMVKAILEGRKTITRRLTTRYYGEVGDRLWVKEAFTPIPGGDTTASGVLWDVQYVADDHIQEELLAPISYNPMLYNYYRPTPSIFMPRWASRILLKVTDVKVERLQDITEGDAEKEGMPDEYPIAPVYCPVCHGGGTFGTNDRRTLGHIDIDCPYCDTASKKFKNLWGSINGKKQGKTWEDNPWVWVVEFRRVENV